MLLLAAANGIGNPRVHRNHLSELLDGHSSAPRDLGEICRCWVSAVQSEKERLGDGRRSMNGGRLEIANCLFTSFGTFQIVRAHPQGTTLDQPDCFDTWI